MELKGLKKKIEATLIKNNVKKLSVFGSVARGDNKKGSDIDLLVKFKGERSLIDLISLKNDLEDKLNCKVDLVTYDSVNPLFKNSIFKDEVKIYG
jgi:predicted nucleotidyltransferase